MGRLNLAGVLLLLGACVGTISGPETQARDAGTPDAGSTPEDAGPPADDAGTSEDAGTLTPEPDAGPRDAGYDAGRDAHVVDLPSTVVRAAGGRSPTSSRP